MSTALSLPSTVPSAFGLTVETPPENLAQLVHQLGDIPLDRIRMQPPPGTAGVGDLLAWNHSKQGPRCELVDGVLVEKAMSYLAAILEGAILEALRVYNRSTRLGVVTSASGEHQLRRNLVRLPDVGYAFWHRFPEGRITDDPAPLMAPDLAVEVLSPSNTRREMDRKRREYFEAGTRLVWIVDPVKRTVEVYTAPEQFTELHETDTLDGGQLLPGFVLSLPSLFAELDASAPPPAA